MSVNVEEREEREKRFVDAFRVGKFVNLTTGLLNPYEIETWWNNELTVALTQNEARVREEERWRCAGIVENYVVPNPKDFTEERRINELLDEIQESIDDPEEWPIDEETGQFIITPKQPL